MSNEPQPDTALGVHETVLELMKNERLGRILDAGAGEGALTGRLIKIGFDVEACDLNPERFKLATKKCKKIDLNEALPYPNESFNFIICIEVIEHLRDPWHAISEFKRVLRRNGKLIITTPNILSVISRLSFLLLGEYSYFSYGYLWKEAVETCQRLDKHINPISFIELEYILLKNHFRLEKIATNEYRSGKLPSSTSARSAAAMLLQFIAFLMYPFIKVVMRKRFGKKSLLHSDELLSGETLILKAAK